MHSSCQTVKKESHQLRIETVKLQAYYKALSLGPSHNYYTGRSEADITPWLEYFIEGMSVAFENVLSKMQHAKQHDSQDLSDLLHTLDPKQRKALELFSQSETVTSRQIGELFNFKPRTSSGLCKQWVESGFLTIVDHSKKSRRYQLAKKYRNLF